ncbi:MAG: 7TM diverse intracellular signaling domain-containing protein [Ramlibacter sp.]
MALIVTAGNNAGLEEILRSMGQWLGRQVVRAAILLGMLLPAAAWARTVLDLDAAKQPVALNDWGDYWIDPSGQATPEAVDGGAASWQPTRAPAVYALRSGQVLWVRFTVPPAPDNERWYLEIPYASVDRASLYTHDSAGQWNEQRAGDLVAVSDWPVPHRHPLLPIVVSAEEPRKYLLRIENAHSFGAPLAFVSESYLYRSEQRVSLILGIYFGLAGLAVMLSALSAMSLRDTAYGLYGLSVALMGLTQASMTGIAGLHLWPGLPAWNDISPLLLSVLTMASLLWFGTAVLSLPERSRHLTRAMASLAVLGLAVCAALAVVERSHRFQLMTLYIVLSLLAAVLVTLWAWRRGDRYGLWLLAGTAPVMLGAAFPLARIAGLIPVSFWTLHGMQIGIALELPVLLVILMLRSQQRREHNRRIQGLDRLDPATGLINAPVFAERLMRMIARSQRLKHQSVVLVIDLVNVEQIQRDFDRHAAEELPLRVAGRLLSAAREIDSVARLSERRFGMLVEGPLTPEEAAQAGPRVVARGLMPFKNKPLEWVAQLRVAHALVPLDGTDAQQVLEQMGALLASVPPDSKRAVFSLHDEAAVPRQGT